MPGAGPWLRSQDRSPVATRALSRGRPTSCGPQVIYCEIRDIETWLSRSLVALDTPPPSPSPSPPSAMDTTSSRVRIPAPALSHSHSRSRARASRSGFVSITLHTPRPTRRKSPARGTIQRDSRSRTGGEVSRGKFGKRASRIEWNELGNTNRTRRGMKIDFRGTCSANLNNYSRFY